MRLQLTSSGTILDLEVQGDRLRATVNITREHRLLDGHFDGFAIFPGIGQIDLIHAMLERHIGRTVNITKVARAKFLAMVRPDISMTVDVEMRVENVATWEIKSGDILYSKGHLEYELGPSSHSDL